MSKRIMSLFYTAALAILASAWLSGAAQAGPPSVCGNGTQEGSEGCDDGNTLGGDGCSATCIPEVCGDDILEPVTEECDDGNTLSDDGCSATCTIECGDGNVTGAEVCDDGNKTNGDGCDDDVTTDPPGNCTVTACGNAVVTGTEQCDDGNTLDGDGCSATCTTESNPLDKDQQKCVNAVNKAFAGVLKAQGTDDQTCVKAIAKGDDTPAACIGQDKKGKVGKAQGKVSSAFSGKKCQIADPPGPPGFAFTDATTVNNAAEAEVLASFATVFGATPTIADSSDKAGTKCQSEVLKQLNGLTNAYAAAFNTAKKSAIKGGKGNPPNPAPVANGAELAAVIDPAVAANSKVTKAESKANTGIGGKCTDAQVDGFFDCGGATTVNALTLCVIAEGKRAACAAAEDADGLDLACPGD